jgi:tetratricopeptide (TPR) repeat protein
MRCPLAISLVLVLASAFAHAQTMTPAQRKKAAKAHFEQGRAYYDAGAYDDAAREYQQAYALTPAPELLFNVAQAFRLKGDKPRAIEAYQRYLEKVTEGDLADEARDHVVKLKLKIQLEETEAARKRDAEAAEAARKKAAEEVATAQRRAEEADAARRRAEEAAAARPKLQPTDEAQLMRLAAEATARREREAEARRRRVEVAQGNGSALRATGALTAVAGALSLGLVGIFYMIGNEANEKLTNFNHSGTDTGSTTDASKCTENTWCTTLADAETSRKSASKMTKLFTGLGSGLLASGVALYVVGAIQRSRAVDAAQVTLAPVVTPTAAALAITGRY